LGRHVNRIKGLCAILGIYDYEPLRRDRLQRLDKLLTGDGRGLPARLKAEIVREIKRLEIALEMIATVEAERDGILKNKRSSHLHADKIKRLAKLDPVRLGPPSPPVHLQTGRIEDMVVNAMRLQHAM
jgi:transposase